MRLATFVDAVLLAAIIFVWMWTWWWNRRAKRIELEAVRYVLVVIRNSPPRAMSEYERTVWREGVDDAMAAYLAAVEGKETYEART